MSTLKALNLTLGYDEKEIIKNINIKIPEGKITALIGSNGCGKSTILRSLSRLLRPKVGSVLLDGKEIQKYSPKEVARKLAILPQNPIAPEGLSVESLCYYGRHPHKKIFSGYLEKDHKIVEWALKVTNMTDLKDRSLDSLSGGQRQRAWIAMSLSQETGLLLLDEPTTYLDLAHQIEVIELLKKINRTSGCTIVMVHHDLNQAARYADHLICIKNGSIYNEGTPKEVFTVEMIKNVFGINSVMIEDPVSKTPMCIPVAIENAI